MAALDTLSFTNESKGNGTTALVRTGQANVTVQTPVQSPVISISKAIANAAAGGGDTMLDAIYTVPMNSTVNVDLQSFVDVLNRTGGSFARIKFWRFWLLNVADGGTACSGVVIGNAAANGNKLIFGAITHTAELLNGEYVEWGTRQAAGRTVGGSTKIVLATNSDTLVDGKLKVTAVGGSS